jgi:hypothetical protein
VTDLAYLLTGDPDEVITWRGHVAVDGAPLRGSRRSIAHLEVTDQAALQKFGTHVVVIQPAYHQGVEASAGSHDYDAVYDVYLPGVDWWDAQRFLREHGWAAWYRYTGSFADDQHIHMISLGYTTRVGYLIPGQVSDYYAHKSGLVGHAADTSWHPADIDSTIFNYPAWVRAQEDDMPYSDWPKADRDALVNDVAGAVVEQLLDADLFPKMKDIELTVQQALKGKDPSKS